MCAWVRNIALRLLPRSHGPYLHLRAGFDRLIQVFTHIDFFAVRAACARIIQHQSSKHWEHRGTIAAVYPEGRQP